MKRIVRRCVSIVWNRQFLIFLFFLGLSTAFWFFQALNEQYEQEVEVPLELHGVPTNVVVTTDLPPTIRVSLRDRGALLLSYLYGASRGKVVIDFPTYANAAGAVSIPTSDLLKQVSQRFEPSTQITGIHPETIDYYYNYGECKRVPVRLQGRITPSRLFCISRYDLASDSVTVYAAQSVLDTITAAYVEPLNLQGLTDTTKVDLKFRRVKGAKYVPNHLGLTLCVDRLVEKTVSVPVQQVNFPASKQLRTFPSHVNVTFQVGMGLYRRITKDNFVLVVNYEDLLRQKTNKCHLSLKTVPAGVSHVRISPQEVEFIIEEIPETDVE